MSGLTSNQLNLISFMTGVGTSGALTAVNGWTWNGNYPATYGTSESAHKWGGGAAGSAGGTVYYYFDPGSNWSTAEKTAFTSSLALWSAEANITFVATTSVTSANIVFYRYGSTTAASNGVTLGSGAYAVGNYTPGTAGSTSIPATNSGYLSINTNSYGWQDITSFSYAGSYGINTVVHEIGHLLGLMHSGPYNGEVNPATQQLNAYDTEQWSIMSYISPTTTTAKYYSSYAVTDTNWTLNNVTYSPTTPMPLDILAAQQLYGVPTSTPLNNVTFGFNCTIVGACKPFFDFTQNTNPVITLYATGLNNTFDLSGWSTPDTVNLNAGTFSSADGMTNNIGIAYNTQIDTVICGAGNDTITVNAYADTINGGGGTNTVVFSGTYASYTTGPGAGGTYTVTLNGVTDTLINVQSMQFADQTVPVSNARPTVAAMLAAPVPAATTGSTITLTMDMSAPVAVAGGVPTLELNDGGVASYTGGSDTDALTFSYTVEAGQRTADLAVTGSALNGATITDGSGDAADLSGADVTPTNAPRILGEAQISDFTGSGTSDVLLSDPTTGALSDFVMNAGQPTWAPIGEADPSLQVVGTGDLTGSGTDDILFRDPTSGALSAFVMQNNQPSWTNLGWADPSYQVAGVGDFTGSGTDDVLFLDPATGALGDFVMNNGQASWQGIGSIGADQQVVGIGDINGDGTDDIVLRNDTTGVLSADLMQNNQPTLATIGWADPTLEVVGVGDFTGSGTDDILFRDLNTGALSDFLMNGGQPTWQPVGWADPSLQVAGIADINGDGTDDILFRDPTSGGISAFVMHDNQPTWTPVGWAATNWQVAGSTPPIALPQYG